MYSVRENPPKHIRDALQMYDDLTRRLLYARGITTQENAEFFLQKEWITTDPYQYADMQKANQRILDAVVNNETIGIFSDYDCDGIPAAAALYSALSAFGHKNIIYYVPDRNTDGFGLNNVGIEKMINGHASVVCILDCGTSSPNEVATLEDAGISTIILDHHLAGKTAPKPFAMINPVLEQRIKKPHPCAAGVVYLFIQALIQKAQNIRLRTKPAMEWEKWQLDLIGLATLSDMVPLRGINRQLVHYGLHVLRKSPRPGIQALCSHLNINQQKIAQDDLSFLIIPRINAASRMGKAETAFTLLTTDNIEEAMSLAKELTTLNNRRKTAVATITRAAHKQAENKSKEKEVWVFGNREWKPSLAGLVAQKLAEAYNKTIFVWGQGGDNEGKTTIKGSCRSLTHDVFNLMQKLPDTFVEAGGHRQAGGFTLHTGAEITLEDTINCVISTETTPLTKLEIDIECAVSDTEKIFMLYEKFSPFGMENEPICIAIPKCRIHRQFTFGKNQDHTRYTIADETGYIDGVSFFTKHANTTPVSTNQILRAVIGQVEFDTFRNKPRLRVSTFIH